MAAEGLANRYELRKGDYFKLRDHLYYVKKVHHDSCSLECENCETLLTIELTYKDIYEGRMEVIIPSMVNQ